METHIFFTVMLINLIWSCKEQLVIINRLEFFLTIYQEFQLFFLNRRIVQKHWKMQLKDVEFLGLRQPDGTSSLER